MVSKRNKKYDQAFVQALKIDNGLGLQGREILEFADITLKDGQLDIAMKAYGNILDRGKTILIFQLHCMDMQK